MFFNNQEETATINFTSNDVFAKRRENLIDEAYQMALQLITKNHNDEWNVRALAWCLIDLIKRDSSENRYERMGEYLMQLNGLKLPKDDEVLVKSIARANRTANPLYAEILKAQELSKNKQFRGSIDLYQNIILRGDESLETHLSLAWDLYRYSKTLLEQDPPNINLVKRNLNTYLKLNIEKPSLVNSLMLRIALNIARLDKLDMAIFLKMWGNEFNEEDYDPFTTDDGRDLPSLFESVLLQALKDALKSLNKEILIYYKPLLEKGLIRYPNNIWFVMRKAQLLIALDERDEAKKYARELVKEKSKDYWAWELMGDTYIEEDKNLGISCFSKALLCSQDINFTGKLKIKLASYLASIGEYSAAKYEVQSLIDFKNNNDQKVPKEAQDLQKSHWFISTETVNQNNKSLYLQYSVKAEELLYEDIVWQPASLGSTFTIERKDKKSKRTMRRVYLESDGVPEELAILESEIKFANKSEGSAIKLKVGEDHNGRTQVYMLAERKEGKAWDVFSEKLGVVDHVNNHKNLIHFIVDKSIDGIVNFKDLKDKHAVGDSVAVRLSKYQTKTGLRYRVLDCKKSDMLPSEIVLRSFKEESVDRISGFGFTNGNIFIPADLVKKYDLKENQILSGKAIISFDKKYSQWGWRVIEIFDDCFDHEAILYD